MVARSRAIASRRAGETVKVGCVQLRARDLDAYRDAAGDVYAALKRYGRSHDLLVFPECAYPGYFLDPDPLREEAVETVPQFLLEVSRLAREYETYVAVGVAERGQDGRLYNRIALIDRNGDVLTKASKQHLWHFDNNWFTEGDGTVVVDTDYGPIGLVVCADARLPEIIRQATVAGARLIIDCANLTAQGALLSEVSNPQVDYVLGVRALENGVWLLMADKWGIEGDFATYAGRSSIYCPHGEVMVGASAVGDTVVSYEIPLMEGKLDEKFRTAALAQRCSVNTAVLNTWQAAVTVKIEDPVRVGAMLPFVSVVAVVGTVEPVSYARLVQRLWRTDTDLICWPPMSEDQFAAVGGGAEGPEHVASVAAVRTTGGLELYLREGSTSWELMTTRTPIVQMHWGALGIIRDEDIRIPEVARQLMLDGVDVIYWPHRARTRLDLDQARTRALENRVFVCAVASSDETGYTDASYIIDPAGAILARTILGQPLHVAQTLVPVALTRIKDVVPGTNVLTGRRPERYTTL